MKVNCDDSEITKLIMKQEQDFSDFYINLFEKLEKDLDKKQKK